MAETNIKFYDFHKPVLQDGEYTIEIDQAISVSGKQSTTDNNSSEAADNPKIESKSISFFVSGPRFYLDPSLIYSVYPPDGGKGDYLADLPSLVLNRSTLPWERSPAKTTVKNNSASWLFLLLIHEDGTSKIVEHNGIVIDDSFPIRTDKEERDRLPKKANYLELDESLKYMFPPLNDLEYLSYARIEDGGEEKSVILCNRLPKKGVNSIVYLVSLENNYQGSDFEVTIRNKKFVLPYLHKWQFHTFDDELFSVNKKNAEPEWGDLSSIYENVFTDREKFETALKSLNIDSNLFKDIETHTKLPGTSFHELLTHLPGGFQALSLDPTSQKIERTGTLNLAYNKLEKVTDGTLPFYTNANYRGPLAAGRVNAIDDHFPLNKNGSIPKHPGNLILSNADLEDLTYASAYELGILMALNDVDFSTEFYKWKNETAMAKRLSDFKNNTRYKNIDHLPLTDSPKINPIPDHVKTKFQAWQNLVGIPFRYLLPDPRLLPNESIRFFQVDNNWVNAFICGAFSIGHTVEADLTTDLKKLFQTDLITGFLINSIVVKAWPDFEVDAYNKISNRSEMADASIPFRKDNLNANIQLYLYKGDVKQLNFHLHPGKMHSGFLFEAGNYLKKKKGEKIPEIPEGHIKAEINKDFVVNISNLRKQMDSCSVSQFACNMIEGTPTVVFRII